jgi:hypothetical protein
MILLGGSMKDIINTCIILCRNLIKSYYLEGRGNKVNTEMHLGEIFCEHSSELWCALFEPGGGGVGFLKTLDVAP